MTYQKKKIRIVNDFLNLFTEYSEFMADGDYDKIAELVIQGGSLLTLDEFIKSDYEKLQQHDQQLYDLIISCDYKNITDIGNYPEKMRKEIEKFKLITEWLNDVLSCYTEDSGNIGNFCIEKMIKNIMVFSPKEAIFIYFNIKYPGIFKPEYITYKNPDTGLLQTYIIITKVDDDYVVNKKTSEFYF